MESTVKELQKKEESPVAKAEARARVYAPTVDIAERKDDFLLIADMPGVDEGSLFITVEQDALAVSGRVASHDLEGLKPAYEEFRADAYERTFTLSEEIDRENIKATMKNGVLKLVLPKAEKAKARKIVITSS